MRIIQQILTLTGLFLMTVGFVNTAYGAKIELQSGDRIVFLGDSITQAGAGPDGYVTLVRNKIAAKHADKKVEVIGAGISGHKVPDLEARLDRDVISKKPTKVIIYIGINDVWHSLNGRGTSKEDYKEGLGNLIDRIEAAGAQAILCTPSVIGEKTDGSNKLDAMLDEYCAISRQVAKQKKVALIDLRKRFLTKLQRANKDQNEKGVLTSDGVHLNKLGNQFVARQMLLALRAIDRPGENRQKAAKPQNLLRHVVIFRFKEGTSEEKIKEVEKAFAALPTQIDVIHDYEWGTNNSPEGLNDEFTHCFVVTFTSEDARAKYLPHPAHKAFVSLIGPVLDKPFVIDYWAK